MRDEGSGVDRENGSGAFEKKERVTFDHLKADEEEITAERVHGYRIGKLMGYPPKKITGKTTIEVSGHEIQLILLSFGFTHKDTISN